MIACFLLCAPCLVPEDALDVRSGKDLVVEPVRNAYCAGRITILDDNQMIWLEEFPPLLQKVQAPNGWDHEVQLVGEWR